LLGVNGVYAERQSPTCDSHLDSVGYSLKSWVRRARRRGGAVVRKPDRSRWPGRGAQPRSLRDARTASAANRLSS